MISLLDLVKALTSEQLRASLLIILTTLGFPTTSWHLGSVIRAMVSLFAAALAPFTDLQVKIASGGFLDWAEEEWLDLLAEQVYDTPRIKATFATGFIKLTNSAGGNYPFAARQCRFINRDTGKIYWNTTSFTLTPFQTNLPPVPIEAIELGSASTSNAGEIDALETGLIGVTVTNQAAVVGFDAEKDPALRLRCRLKFGSLSPAGPRDAYEYLARTFSLNGGVTVTRTSGQFDSAIGAMTLYIAGPSGPIGAPDVAKVQQQIDVVATPLGFDCTVVSVTSVTINVSSQVYYYGSQNLLGTEVMAAVEAQLTAWMQTLPIGGDIAYLPEEGFVFVDAIKGQIMQARTVPGAPQQIHYVDLFGPMADVPLDAGQVAVPGSIGTIPNPVAGP
jgi:phage-related baseplate assembly protein